MFGGGSIVKGWVVLILGLLFDLDFDVEFLWLYVFVRFIRDAYSAFSCIRAYLSAGVFYHHRTFNVGQPYLPREFFFYYLFI